jgi:acetoin utilization protein AcuB
MFISRFMTKDVVTLATESDIAAAKKLMVRYRIRHLPVTRPDSTLLGIVSDRDIRSAMPSKHIHGHGINEMEAEILTGVPVQEIMTKDPVSVSLSSTIQDALLLMEKTRVGAFPVVDEKLKVVGIVSDRDSVERIYPCAGHQGTGRLAGHCGR